jgi:protein-S-isoprenylcysteine O-methyltransferase Ste14
MGFIGRRHARLSWREILVDQRVPMSYLAAAILAAVCLIQADSPRTLFQLSLARAAAAGAFVLAGVAWRSWAAGHLHKKTVLATSGPYGLCRHPLYLGSLAILLGFSLLLKRPESLWIALSPLLLVYHLAIGQEERRLAERHGQAWSAYAASVPRLIPSWRAIGGRSVAPIAATALRGSSGRWAVATWLRNREYRALAAAPTGLAAIALWYSLAC